MIFRTILQRSIATKYLSSPIVLSQPLWLRYSTISSCPNHFLFDQKNENAQKIQHYKHPILRITRSIHLHNNPLNLKYSNTLEQQKVNNDDRKEAEKIATEKDDAINALEEHQKLGLFARFKKMAKEYWYVLVPVHVVTSCGWFGLFYYASVRYD